MNYFKSMIIFSGLPWRSWRASLRLYYTWSVWSTSRGRASLTASWWSSSNYLKWEDIVELNPGQDGKLRRRIYFKGFNHTNIQGVPNLQPASTTTSLLAGSIGGDGGAILDTSNLHASTGQGAEGGLGTGSGSLGPVAAGGTELDVQSSNSKGLKWESLII